MPHALSASDALATLALTKTALLFPVASLTFVETRASSVEAGERVESRGLTSLSVGCWQHEIERVRDPVSVGDACKSNTLLRFCVVDCMTSDGLLASRDCVMLQGAAVPALVVHPGVDGGMMNGAAFAMFAFHCGNVR